MQLHLILVPSAKSQSRWRGGFIQAALSLVEQHGWWHRTLQAGGACGERRERGFGCDVVLEDLARSSRNSNTGQCRLGGLDCWDCGVLWKSADVESLWLHVGKPGVVGKWEVLHGLGYEFPLPYCGMLNMGASLCVQGCSVPQGIVWQCQAEG